jgi:hypothetical protein
MKQCIAAALLVTLNACVITTRGPTFVPVEQAAMHSDEENLRESLGRLAPLMASHGYRVKGEPFQSADGAITRLLYEGPADSEATFTFGARGGCVSFVTSVKEGTQDYKAPKAVFGDVVRQLRQEGGLENSTGPDLRKAGVREWNVRFWPIADARAGRTAAGLLMSASDP